MSNSQNRIEISILSGISHYKVHKNEVQSNMKQYSHSGPKVLIDDMSGFHKLIIKYISNSKPNNITVKHPGKSNQPDFHIDSPTYRLKIDRLISIRFPRSKYFRIPTWFPSAFVMSTRSIDQILISFRHHFFIWNQCRNCVEIWSTVCSWSRVYSESTSKCTPILVHANSFIEIRRQIRVNFRSKW